MNIVIIDYSLGNLRSVYNAIAFLGEKPKITELPEDVRKADKIILPGVGAFKDAMLGLKKRGLRDALKEAFHAGKIYLGICLGLQVLFENSEEGDEPGLGVLKGRVRRFSEKNRIKIPQIGWNTVRYPVIPLSGYPVSGLRLVDGIKDNSYFYFDHSYYADPEDKKIITGITNHGIDFASMVCKGNIFGVQFHPERSQALGLKLLENFIKL